MKLRASQFLLLAVLLLSAEGVFAQNWRVNRIYRPCPGSSTPASVDLDRDGDVNVTPCPGREFGITAPTLKVYDPTYTGGTASTTSRFLVGSKTPQTIPSTNSFVGVDLWAQANMSGSASKDFSGIRNYHAVTGNGTATTYFGIYNQHLESSGFSGSYDGIYGFWNRMTPNQGSLTGTMTGSRISVGPGGGGFTTDPSSTITGVYSNALHGYSVTADEVISVDARTQGANAFAGASVNHLVGLNVRHWGGSGTAAFNTVQNRYGIRIGNYATVNYQVSNNYGIFIDPTIDELGTTYAIYSQSVSPSFLSGPLSFDATFAGVAGDRTINKPAFEVKIDDGSSQVTVTNSFVATDSKLLCTVQDNDATLKSVSAVVGAGSVVLHGNAAATAETRVYCEVRFTPYIPD